MAPNAVTLVTDGCLGPGASAATATDATLHRVLAEKTVDFVRLGTCLGGEPIRSGGAAFGALAIAQACATTVRGLDASLHARRLKRCSFTGPEPDSCRLQA